MDSSEACFKLRAEFGGSEDSFDDEQPKVLKETIPELENGWASYGNFQLVGNGKVTSDACGKYLSLKGCIRTDLHDVNCLDGKNYAGKVYVKVVHHWCNKPSCPVCFKSGWAVREAGKIEGRLKEASKRFGLAEHIVASVPLRDYGLSFGDLRARMVKAVYARRVIGGVLIFHGFRYTVQKHWYWNPHFHVLGYILGGYGCRNCKKQICSECGGFEARTRKVYEQDDYIVKVLGKRKTVFGTAWYQLNHSSIDVTKKRFHVATWFGVCSYRKLKVTVEKKKELCPICSEELVKLHYSGARRIVKDRGACGYVASFVDDLVDGDGSVNWCEASSGSCE